MDPAHVPSDTAQYQARLHNLKEEVNALNDLNHHLSQDLKATEASASDMEECFESMSNEQATSTATQTNVEETRQVVCYIQIDLQEYLEWLDIAIGRIIMFFVTLKLESFVFGVAFVSQVLGRTLLGCNVLWFLFGACILRVYFDLLMDELQRWEADG